MRCGFLRGLLERCEPVHRVAFPQNALFDRRLANQSVRRCSTMVGSPADWLRFSRSRDPIQQDPFKRQEWQIVQSQLDLRDLLP